MASPLVLSGALPISGQKPWDLSTPIDEIVQWNNDLLVDLEGGLYGAPGGGGAVISVAGRAGAVVLTAADSSETTTRKWMTDTERTRLGGMQDGATANSPDAALLDLGNHTGSLATTRITGLDAALTARALASATVNLTGAQTVAGVKTFSSGPVVPDSSFAISKVTGLQTQLTALGTDALTIARLPAGSIIRNDYVFGGTNAYPVRPTARTDIVVIWRGPTAPSNAAGYALPGDEWRVKTS